jgi:hypothetical protein
MNKLSFYVAGLAIALLMAAQTALAVPVIAYEWTEGGPGNGTNSIHWSQHITGGPVLADDFQTSVSGRVTQVDWWGSAPLTGLDNWEITFHPDAGGLPQAVVSSQHLPVVAGGVDPDGDGVFFYSALWQPQDMFVSAGVDYWFSVANAQGPNWFWANAGGVGPTVGSELYTGAVSAGAPGSPHFGPWSSVFMADGTKQDFAFRIWVEPVPIPPALWLFGSGLLGLVGMAKRKKAA